MKENLSRRSFFQLALTSLIAVPVLLRSTEASATACSKTPPKGKKLGSPTAGMGKSLEYVEVAADSKHAKFKAGQDCGNCKFYQAAKQESGYAPCTMMGMAYVAGCGWCKSYLKK